MALAAVLLIAEQVPATDSNLLPPAQPAVPQIVPRPAKWIPVLRRGDRMEFLFGCDRFLLATPVPLPRVKEAKGLEELLRKGRFHEASLLIENRLLNRPENGRLLLAAAGIYLLEGKLEAAREKLALASDLLGANNMPLAALEGTVLLFQRQRAEAEVRFLRLAKAGPWKDVGLCGLGHLRLLEGAAQKALSHYGEALRLRPRSLGYRLNYSLALWLSGQPGRGADVLQQAVRDSPGFGEGFLLLGLARLASGEPLLAAAALMRAEELQVGDARLYPALGTACRAAEMDRLAVRYLEKAVEQVPEDESLRDQLVVSLMKGGQLFRAGQVLSQSRVLEGEDAQAHFLLGLKLLLCDQPQAAARVLFRTVALGKRDSDAFFALGQALLLSDLPQPATTALRVALQLSPRRSEARFVLALALSQLGEHKAALTELQEVIRATPDDINALQLEMELLRKSGDPRQCAAVGRRLLEGHPDLLDVRFTVALCLAEAGELDPAYEQMQDALERDQEGQNTGRALRQLKRLVGTQTEVAGWHMLLALVYQYRGDWGEAVRALERFILVAPSPRWTQRAVVWLHQLVTRP